MKFALTAIWSALFAVIFAIWVVTASQLGIAGLWSALAVLLIIPPLFVVEGLELAVAALLGRKVNLHGGAGRELDRLQKDRSFNFFPARQAFVVVGISVVTIFTSFDAIYIPGLGWITDYNAPFWFNLTFVTLMVLLLAQVPSKRLALQDPELFYRHTWAVCTVVRWLGKTRLTEPAEIIVRVLARILKYPARPRRAPPDVRLYFDSIDNCWLIIPADFDSAADCEQPKTH